MEYKGLYTPDMPMGLDIALALNRPAMDYFYSLTDAEQRQIIEHTHGISSKEEMRAYVNSLTQGNL